jgi:hypothetical protein
VALGMSARPLAPGFLRAPGPIWVPPPGAMIEAPGGRVVKKMSKIGKNSLVI